MQTLNKLNWRILGVRPNGKMNPEFILRTVPPKYNLTSIFLAPWRMHCEDTVYISRSAYFWKFLFI
jgi:hypothetical protein